MTFNERELIIFSQPLSTENIVGLGNKQKIIVGRDRCHQGVSIDQPQLSHQHSYRKKDEKSL